MRKWFSAAARTHLRLHRASTIAHMASRSSAGTAGGGSGRKRSSAPAEDSPGAAAPPRARRTRAKRAAEPEDNQALAAAVAAAAGEPAADSRCGWVSLYKGAQSAEYIEYHDKEWGRPLRDDRALFELLTLEGAQAGLSWSTILAKREGYRRAFVDWDVKKIAAFGPQDVERLLLDGGIVRHRGKIESTINNAQRVLELKDGPHGSLSGLLWSFVPDGRPIVNRWTELSQVPSKTAESDLMSKELKKRGFKFMGSTTCYSLMQAAGLVNDHIVTCPWHERCAGHEKE